MIIDLKRRLARLEATAPPLLRQRYVFLRKAEPDPEPEPGEQLTIIRWLEHRNEEPVARATTR